MRFIVLFIGLFSLLFFAGTNTGMQHYQTFSKADKSICFEAACPGVIWGIEKSETSQVELNDRKASKGKKRFSQHLYKYSYISGKISSTLAGFRCAEGLKINLFLYYHSSLSLLQVFLQ